MKDEKGVLRIATQIPHPITSADGHKTHSYMGGEMRSEGTNHQTDLDLL